MEAARQLEEEKKKMADTAISLQQNLEVGYVGYFYVTARGSCSM